MHARAFLASALVLALVASGCMGARDDGRDDDRPDWMDAPYLMEGDWSTPRQPARYEVLPAVQAVAPARDGIDLSVGVFLPDIPGCDWEATDLPDECRLPVLMDGGPYYLDRITIDKGRPPWIDWLVPRGYAVVQMALRGTGESGGCMAFKAPQDMEDASDAVDWIVAQPWSNGNVAVGGRSYHGTTAWAAAASGNPAVKTILPISGAVDGPGLYFRNGTHETRALVPHIATYWATYAMGLGAADPTYRIEDWSHNICPEVALAHVHGPLTAFTGDASSEYWQSRDLRGPLLKDYGGSVWVVHGMRDWNVDPSQAVPFVNDMMDAGIEVRAWLGHWAHHYPDHSPEHENVRWDWSDQIVTWLDFYLRGEGPQPWLGVEVEDDTWRWRTEARYPPGDVAWVEYEAGGGTVVAPQGMQYTWDVEAPGIVAGLPQLRVTVTPASPVGGYLFAELYATHDGSERRIGWSPMSLPNHAGGNTDPQFPLVPLQPITLMMQFEPMDAPLYEGDTLRLVLHRNGVTDIAASPDMSPLPIGDVVLRLSMVEGTGFLEIPLGEDDPRRGR